MMNDAEKREQLIKSYEGQIAYWHKIKHQKTPERQAKAADMIRRWSLRIERVKSGEPLENFVGKKLGKDG